VVFVAILLRGHPSLLQEPRSQGGYFDAQAHSLLDLRWDVPPEVVSFEGFRIDEKFYMYFGPLPALLRLPVAAVTDSLDGKLGSLSLLLAFGVAMAFTIRITARTRPLIRGSVAVTRREQWVTGTFVFVVGAGSLLVFLASETWVYHEAVLWGVALALGGFDQILAYVTNPTGRHLLLASVLASASLLSRGSVGTGPVAALALLLLASRWSRLRRLSGMVGGAGAGLVPLGLALLLPVALYAFVNHAKFGTWFSVPWRAQVSAAYPFNQEILAANGGSRFNVELIPTSFVQYFRPDGTVLRSLFPWVGFGDGATDVGDVVTERIGNASWITSMPLLTVLAAIGLAGLIRARRAGVPALTALAVPVAGAAVGCVPTLAYTSLSQRYMADFLPLTLLLAAPGVHLLLRWAERTSRPARRAAIVGLGALGAVSVWCNVGLSVWYQRLIVPATHFTDASLGTDEEGADFTSFLAFQYDLHEGVPGGRPPYVAQGDRLPSASDHRGDVFVLGECDSLYWSDGASWRVVERSEGGGLYRLRVRFPESPTGWEPLLVNGRGDDAQHLSVRVLEGDRLQVAYNRLFATDPIPVRPGAFHDVDVLMDTIPGSAASGAVSVTVDGVPAWDAVVPNRIITDELRPLDDVSIGRADVPDVAPSFGGTIERRPAAIPLCRELAPRSH